jgi:hypothetical protein
MIAERVRSGLRGESVPGLRGSGVRVSASGAPRLPRHWKNESARPWCASLPNSLESIPGQYSASAALSTAQASPSDNHWGYEMRGAERSSVLRVTVCCRSGRRTLGVPELKGRLVPFGMSCLPASISLPYPGNERLYGWVLRPALAGIVVHCRKAIQPRDIWIVAHIDD